MPGTAGVPSARAGTGSVSRHGTSTGSVRGHVDPSVVVSVVRLVVDARCARHAVTGRPGSVGSRTANSVWPGRLVTLDVAAVRRDDRRHDRQAEPGAAVLPGPRRGAAGEPLEDVRQQVGRDARARRRPPSARAVPDPAASVTVTVVPGGVCVRALASRLASTWCSRDASPGTVTGSSGRSSCQRWSGPGGVRVADRVEDEPGEVDVGALQRPSGVEAGEQQQVLDQRRHPLGLRGDPRRARARRPAESGPRRVSSA